MKSANKDSITATARKGKLQFNANEIAKHAVAPPPQKHNSNPQKRV
jgi:hypothetical protein